jgi:hypothetical protein
MALGDRLRKLITGQLEGQGGFLFVMAKNFIVKNGCSRRNEALVTIKAKWDQFSKSFDIPWVPEVLEVQVETMVWARIEKGFNAFADKICTPSAGAPEDELFGAPEQLAGDSEVMRMANDPTLPPL